MEQLEKPEMRTPQRNYGVDALRVLSIFMVLVLHILGLGGVLENTKPLSPAFIGGWLLETAAFCAVNCYALISGYVGIYAKYRYANLVTLWLQVFLYSLLGAVVFRVIDPEAVDIETMLKSAFPVFKKRFWYFSAYFGLFMLLPVLNKGILALNRRQAKVLCVTIVVVFSVMPNLANHDPFIANAGYSLVWLLLLYILGACIRRFGFGSGIRSWRLAVGYILAVVVSLGVMLLLAAKVIPVLSGLYANTVLIRYTSPTILFCGVALLLLFSRMRVKGKWFVGIIAFLAPATFGIYIMHMQPQISRLVFESHLFDWMAQRPVPVMVAGVLLSACVLFVACALIEKLRQLLFDALGVKKRLAKLEGKWVGDLWNSESDTGSV